MQPVNDSGREHKSVDWASAPPPADPECFSDWATYHAPRVHRFLCAQGATVSDGDDLVQETFLRAWRSRGHFRAGATPHTWLFTIARRLWSNHLRDQGRRRHHHARLAAQAAPAADWSPASHEAAIGPLWQEARRLFNHEQFTMLWLRYGEDQDTSAIAAVLGRRPGHVRVTLHRLRQRLGEACAGSNGFGGKQL